MFSKKKTECRVCGYRFTPERENIYTAEEPRSALEMLTAAPTRFSAVDCPICGCQIRLADRAPRIDLPAITEQHDADAEESIHFPFTKGAILRRAIPQGTRLVSFRRSSTTSLNRNTRTALKTLKQRLTSAEKKKKA